MMPRVVLIFIISFCSWSSITSQENNICGLENTAFQSEEILVYKLYYNFSFIWVPAGEATFHVVETDSTYEATVKGRSYGSYDNVFKVRDEYHSVISKETMMPMSFYRKVEEGNHLRYDSIVFDYNLDKIYSLNGRTKETATKDTFPLLECSYDLVSIMYTLRNIEIGKYNPGDVIKTNLFFDKENIPISIDYLMQEKKKVRNLGKYETIKIQPKVIIGNVFKEGDVMHVWVSKDKNKIPLVIESPIMIGSVKAVLLSHDKLKHDFGI